MTAASPSLSGASGDQASPSEIAPPGSGGAPGTGGAPPGSGGGAGRPTMDPTMAVDAGSPGCNYAGTWATIIRVPVTWPEAPLVSAKDETMKISKPTPAAISLIHIVSLRCVLEGCSTIVPFDLARTKRDQTLMV